MLQDLARPVRVYLKVVRENRSRRVSSHGVGCCEMSDQIAKVFKRVVEARMHRVWVKGDIGVKGCVSLTDLFSIINVGEIQD